MKILISISAIPDGLFYSWKKRTKIDQKYDPLLHNHLFAKWATGVNAQRIYISLGTSYFANSKITIPKRLEETLINNGFEVENYAAGTVIKKDDEKKQPRRLGKVLQDLVKKEKCDPSVVDEYIKDSHATRQGTKMSSQLVVISRDPYDIAGASYDRGWRSCLHLTDGENRHFLANDVQYGTLIAYLIDEDDKEIIKPSARYRIVRYVNKSDKNDVLFVRQPNMHGTAPNSFALTIDSWLEQVNGKKEGLFCVKQGEKGVYDEFPVKVHVRETIHSLNQLKSWLPKLYKMPFMSFVSTLNGFDTSNLDKPLVDSAIAELDKPLDLLSNFAKLLCQNKQGKGNKKQEIAMILLVSYPKIDRSYIKDLVYEGSNLLCAFARNSSVVNYLDILVDASEPVRCEMHHKSLFKPDQITKILEKNVSAWEMEKICDNYSLGKDQIDLILKQIDQTPKLFQFSANILNFLAKQNLNSAQKNALLFF